MSAPDRFLGMLGLAKRAGRVVIGAPLIFAAMRTKEPPRLVIAAADASAGAMKKLTTKCEFYRIPLLATPYTKARLAHAVGGSGEVAAVAVCDAGFAEQLTKTPTEASSAADPNEEI